MYSIAKKWGMCYFPHEHYSLENASLLYCRGRRLSYRPVRYILPKGDERGAAGEDLFLMCGICVQCATGIGRFRAKRQCPYATLEGACNGRIGAARIGAKTTGLCRRVFAVFFAKTILYSDGGIRPVFFPNACVTVLYFYIPVRRGFLLCQRSRRLTCFTVYISDSFRQRKSHYVPEKSMLHTWPDKKHRGYI